MKIGIIGYGAIGTALYTALKQEEAEVRLVSLLEQEAAVPATQALLPGVTVTPDWDAFLSAGPDVVIECAGHNALRRFGRPALEAGRDLVVSSVGALADAETEQNLRSAAEATGRRLIIPAGAAGALDALGAARRAGLDTVSYTSRKVPRAWRGTPAETMIDLDSIREATAFYEGDARSAALSFPQNANVVAAIALAGIGFEKTRVRLMADPDTPGNKHIVEARGAFGEITSSVMAKTLPENPKTSMLAPYSLARSIVNLSNWIIV